MGHVFFGLGPWSIQMAKKATDREYVWLAVHRKR